jgi:putative flippase GtrA
MIKLAQLAHFGWIGVVTAIAHYGMLILLVEGWGAAPVPATLVGYVVGAGVSYTLNRKYTFATERSHGQALWRFLAVAAVGFVATYGLMSLFVAQWRLPYLPMQIVTTLIVMGLSFVGHKFWSFGEKR